MPRLQILKPQEAPSPSRLSRAVMEQQQRYDQFVRRIDTGEVGDLELEPAENARSVKVRLRRASTRVGVDLDIWDADGHVYFKRVTRLVRRRKAS